MLCDPIYMKFKYYSQKLSLLRKVSGFPPGSQLEISSWSNCISFITDLFSLAAFRISCFSLVLLWFFKNLFWLEFTGLTGSKDWCVSTTLKNVLWTVPLPHSLYHLLLELKLNMLNLLTLSPCLLTSLSHVPSLFSPDFISLDLSFKHFFLISCV